MEECRFKANTTLTLIFQTQRMSNITVCYVQMWQSAMEDAQADFKMMIIINDIQS